MFEDENEPRKLRGAALGELAREDLDGYAVDELQDRIAALKAEIDRTDARLQKKRAGLSAADQLFKI